MTISEHRTDPYMTVVRRDGEPSAGDDGSWDCADWQRMWLRLQAQEWRALAFVPGDDQTSTFAVANLVARLALDRGESIRVADLRALRPKHLEAFLEGTRWEATHGTRIVFANGPVSTNLTTVPVARAADFAILCVSLGSTSLRSIKATIEEIGREHFLGSLLVRPPTRASRAKRARRGSRPKALP
jgi:hypothetical protein